LKICAEGAQKNLNVSPPHCDYLFRWQASSPSGYRGGSEGEIVHRPEIRGETFADIEGIREAELAAFPTPGEADLVDQLRQDGSAVYSLVAVVEGEVVGHIMFSRMQAPERSLGLAPVAVVESYRRRGIAAQLIREGLSRAIADGWRCVFVLGDPYYRRFGFDPALAAGFASPYAGPHFMALELQDGVLAAGKGVANYPHAFKALG